MSTPNSASSVDEWPRVESALQVVDSEDREMWVRIGQAIQDEFGEAGFHLWDDWSRTGDNYNEQAARDVWRSFGQGGGITIASLFHLARENGWSDGTQAPRLTTEQAEARQRSREEAQRLNAEAKVKTEAEAARTARKIYEHVRQDDAASHPYAVRKRLDFGPLVRRGDYCGHDCLIVPMYGQDKLIRSLQAIADGPVFTGERDKTFLAGGRKKGCFFPIGPTFIGASRVLIAEGVATGAAVHDATGLPVVVAFDAGNLLPVGEVVRRLAAHGAEIVFCADDDQKPGTDRNTGLEAARKAAEATGGKVVVPALGKKADFWDVWAVLGSVAVRGCVNAAGQVTKPRLAALRRDDLMALPDIEWIIKGAMPARGVGVVYGLSTVGKSFVMVDAAASLAEGREWFGCRVKQRPVAYACLEGQHGFKRRVMAWEAHHGRRFPAEVVFAPDPIDLRSEQDVTALIELAKTEAGPGAVVIVDTLNRAAPGMEENGSLDYGLILASAGRIEQAVGGFVCFVGHPGKDTSKGLRGHSSLFAGLDMTIEVEEVNKDALSFAWTVRKVKDGQDGIKRHFRREVIDLGQDADGDPLTSCVIVPDPEADRANKNSPANAMTRSEADSLTSYKQAAMEYGVLDDAGCFAGLALEDWRTHFYLASPAQNRTAKRVAFNRAKNALINGGWLLEDIYGNLSLIGPGADVHAVTIAGAILEKGHAYQSVTGRNKGVTVTVAEAIKRNVPYQPSLEAVTVTHGPGVGSGQGSVTGPDQSGTPSAGTFNPTNTDGKDEPEPTEPAEVAI